MITIARILLVGLSVLAAASTAAAHKVDVDGVAIDIPVPKGYCPATENQDHPSSISHAYKTSTTDTLLLVAADCSELQRLKVRQDGSENHFEDFIVFSAKWGNLQQPRETFLRQLAETNSHGASVQEATAKGLAQFLQFGAEEQYVNNFGPIDVDASAVYFAAGFVQTDRDGKTRIRNVAVSAHSLIKGVRLVVVRYMPHTSTADLQALLDSQRQLLAGLVMANAE